MSGKIVQVEYLDQMEQKYSEARTLREYTSNLDINSAPPVVRGTGIVCTIGEYHFIS